MTIVPFRKIQTDEPMLKRVQDNLEQVFDGLNSSFLLNSVLQNGINAQGILLSIGDNFISHQLNRIPLGYFITKKNAAVDVYTSSTVSPDPIRLIVLVSTANATVNIVFF